MICRACRRKADCYAIPREPDFLLAHSPFGIAKLTIDKPDQPTKQLVCSPRCQEMIERGRGLWDCLKVRLTWPEKEQVDALDEPEHTMYLDMVTATGRVPWVRIN